MPRCCPVPTPGQRPDRAGRGSRGTRRSGRTPRCPPVIGGGHHQVTITTDPAGVVGRGQADRVAPAVDPHHDRAAGGRVRLRGPDVDRQPVVACRQVRQDCSTVGGQLLRGRRAEVERLPHALPASHRPRRREPRVTHRRLGERYAAEDGEPVLPAAGHPSRHGPYLMRLCLRHMVSPFESDLCLHSSGCPSVGS